MSRTVIVGDVHGCCAELQELLARVGFSDDDHLYFVGDLVGRGPDTLGVLALAQQLGAVAVRGNHEQKLLSFVQSQREGGPLVRLGLGQKTRPELRKLLRWLKETCIRMGLVLMIEEDPAPVCPF